MNENTLQYFVKNFNELFDITASINYSAAKRGENGFSSYSLNHYTEEIPQRTMITFSPQSITHIDLPWHVKVAYDYDDIIPSYPSKLANEYIDDKFLKTPGNLCKMECIIIDVTEIKSNFTKRLMKLDKNISGISVPKNFIFIGNDKKLAEEDGIAIRNKGTDYLFDPFGDVEVIKEALDLLKIDDNILLKTGLKRDDFNDKFVLFKTGWIGSKGFVPEIKNIRNPIWEGLHPYLLHPYLDKSAIDFLGIKNLKGIGYDSIEMENPISYFVNGVTLPSIYNLRSEMIRNERYKPFEIHKEFLGNSKILLENIDLTQIDITGLYQSGILYILPLPSHQFADALPCKAFLKVF